MFYHSKIHGNTAFLATHTLLWIDGYLLPKEMAFQWSNNMYYTWHGFKILANLYPLTKISIENLSSDTR